MLRITKNIYEAKAMTHGDTFHADEVLASVILEEYYGGDLVICRVLEMPKNVPSNIEIVYDIGYGEFDHHQPEKNGARRNGVFYSSAGLIFKKFGKDIISKYISGSDCIDHVFRIVDKELIQGVDAIDNGTIPKYDYVAQPISFSRIISQMNPTYFEKGDKDEYFMRAADIARVVFQRVLKNALGIAMAKDIVKPLIDKCEEKILVLDKFYPWQAAMFSSNNPNAEHILFIVYPSGRGGYNWQCVPKSMGAFDQRKSIPKKWRGLEGKPLQDATGVPDATFCHSEGFIGGAKTKEGAIKIVEKAMSYN